MSYVCRMITYRFYVGFPPDKLRDCKFIEIRHYRKES